MTNHGAANGLIPGRNPVPAPRPPAQQVEMRHAEEEGSRLVPQGPHLLTELSPRSARAPSQSRFSLSSSLMLEISLHSMSSDHCSCSYRGSCSRCRHPPLCGKRGHSKAQAPRCRPSASRSPEPGDQAQTPGHTREVRRMWPRKAATSQQKYEKISWEAVYTQCASPKKTGTS